MTSLRASVLLAFLAGGLSITLAQSSTPTPSAQTSGTRVVAGGDLQAALNAARPGDTILLAPGAEFVGNFKLPERTDTGIAFITIRTDVAGLPAPGVRTGPQFAGKLALIRSATTMPALSTSPGTHHWRIENVEFGPTRNGENEIIALGSGERAQRDVSDVPHDLIFDRVLIHGDPVTGQKRGIALNSASTQILNSHIADIKVLGVDGQAIGGWNGPGPFLIENNYLEASGENVMFGGADPWIDQLVPADVTIRWNHVTRPAAWKDPILAAPSAVRAGPCREDCGRGGGPPAGSYTYRVVAERPVAGATAVSAPGMSAELTVTQGAVVVQWDAVPGVQSYRVFRHGPSGDMWWRAGTTRFVDTGAGGTAEAPPKRGSMWSVKNLLELKNARNVVIEGNLFEHHWPQAQAGYAIVFTPRNQNGRAPWSVVRDVRFSGNVVRQVSGGINISGTDDDKPSARGEAITIENNLFAEVGGSWGEPGDFVQIGNGPANVHIERNTVMQTGRALLAYGSRHGSESPGFVFRNNLLRHNRYGMFGTDVGSGRPAIARYFPGAIVTGNTFAGGSASEYPEGNRFIAANALDAPFETGDPNYRLRNPRGFGAAGAELDTLRDAGVRPGRP